MAAVALMEARKRIGPSVIIHGTSLLVIGVALGWFLSPVTHYHFDFFGKRGTQCSTNRAGVLAVPHRGHLGDVLFKQGLSHLVFHHNRVKSRLASLVAPADGTKGAVGVVGVEYGAEVLLFANEGYTVYAFEPIPLYYNQMAGLIRVNHEMAAKGLRRKWDVRLHNIAAGSERNGTLALKYSTVLAKEKAEVHVGRIEDYVKQELVVLSVDIQGSEIEALRGARRLIDEVGVRSLWVEIKQCNKRVLEVFQLLDEKYAMFDFVPYGIPMKENGELAEAPMNFDKHPSFIPNDGAERSSEFNAFWKWMCDKQKKGVYAWFQSDILAIRRDLVTPELMLKLSTLSHDVLHSIAKEVQARRKELARAKRAKEVGTQPAK